MNKEQDTRLVDLGYRFSSCPLSHKLRNPSDCLHKRLVRVEEPSPCGRFPDCVLSGHVLQSCLRPATAAPGQEQQLHQVTSNVRRSQGMATRQKRFAFSLQGSFQARNYAHPTAPQDRSPALPRPRAVLARPRAVSVAVVPCRCLFDEVIRYARPRAWPRANVTRRCGPRVPVSYTHLTLPTIYSV